jgi:hypothetical protein
VYLSLDGILIVHRGDHPEEQWYVDCKVLANSSTSLRRQACLLELLPPEKKGQNEFQKDYAGNDADLCKLRHLLLVTITGVADLCISEDNHDPPDSMIQLDEIARPGNNMHLLHAA